MIYSVNFSVPRPQREYNIEVDYHEVLVSARDIETAIIRTKQEYLDADIFKINPCEKQYSKLIV